MAGLARVAAVLVTMAMLCPAAAAAPTPGRDEPPGLPWPAPTGISQYPVRVVHVTGSPAGVAWEVQGRWGPGDDDYVVHYTSFQERASDHVVGPVMTADAEGVSGPDFSLVGPQLYVPAPMGVYGLDVDTGGQLPTLRHSCWWRTGTGCLAVRQIGNDNDDWRLQLTTDAGSVRGYPAPLIDGSTLPLDYIYPIATDRKGVLIKVIGTRGSQPASSVGLLTYLDFQSGTYTTLDDSLYAQSDQAAMDARHLVWTHRGHAFDLSRDALTAPAESATSAHRIADVVLSGDRFAYVVKGGALYTGQLGGTDFGPVSVPGTLRDLTSIGGGDFALSAGTSALDYGLYRLRAGHTRAGPLIALYGFSPLDQYLYQSDPGADLNADGRSALATVSPSGTWSVNGGGSIRLGAPGELPVAIDNWAGVARAASFRPNTGRWSIRSLRGDVRHVTFGQAGDVPVPAHYSGRARDAVLATFRPATGRWHIRGRPSFSYGHPGVVPVPGHYFRRSDEAAVFRPGNGSWCVRGHGCRAYGRAGDIPVPGDYDGDGHTDFAVYRPSDHTWHAQGSGTARFGRDGDVPLLGDFDGDGRADIALYRPADQKWLIRGVGVFTFGEPGARPLEAARS